MKVLVDKRRYAMITPASATYTVVGCSEPRVLQLNPDYINIIVGPSTTTIKHPKISPPIIFETRALTQSVENAMGISNAPAHLVEVMFGGGGRYCVITITVHWLDSDLAQNLILEVHRQDVALAISHQSPHAIASSPQGDG